MKRNVIKIIKLIFIVLSFIFLFYKYDNSMLAKIVLSLILGLFLLQFLYGLLFYRLEKYNKKIVLFVLLIIYFVTLFMIKHDSNINIINIMAILFTVSILFRYCCEKRSFHNGIFNILLTLLIYPYLYFKYGDSVLLIGICIPTYLFYFMQSVIFDKEKKINKMFVIESTILFILLSVIMVLNYDKIVFVNDYYVLSFFVLGLLIFLKGLVYVYTIGFTKIELFVYVYLIVLAIFSLNINLIVYLIPLMLLCYSLSIDEKYELFNIKKYIKQKDIKKVSVVIPNYNYGRYMEQRIDSVLKQNYPIYELIVLDDKSTDDSDKVIKEKIKRVKELYPDLIIKYIPNKVNSGNVFKQWTKAFEECTGDYLWICEADDLCSRYLLNAVMYGFKDEDVVLSYVESLAIDENNHIFMQDMRLWNDVTFSGRWNGSYIIDGEESLKKYLCINNSINNASSVVFKKDKNIPVKEYLKNAQSYRLAGDWYFYAKYLLHGKVAYCADSLNYHRLHSNSVTNTTGIKRTYDEVVKVQESVCKDVTVSNATKLDITKYRNSMISEGEVK